MKILLCSIYLPSGRDGVSNSTRQLVSALVNKGVDVTVYTTDWGWTKEEIMEEQTEKLRVFKALLNNNFDCSIEMLRYFRNTCNDYDLIHFNSIYSVSTVLDSYILRRYHIPYIVCPQGNFVPSSNSHYKVKRSVSKKKLFFRLFSRKALINADKVVCNSGLEMEAVRGEVRSDNIMYINNGLDTSLYCSDVDSRIIKERLGISSDKSIFLFLGRLAEEKAIPFLLDVWEYVIKKLSNAVLVIAGSSEHGSLDRIKERIRRLPYPESVLTPGVVTGDLKIGLLQKSKCLLLPSYFESFGNVVLESLASGTPVIASIGTPWESLEENRFGKWLPWDVKAWGKAMLDISANESFQSGAFSKRSKQWVIEKFNWSTIADRYIELYEEIKR